MSLPEPNLFSLPPRDDLPFADTHLNDSSLSRLLPRICNPLTPSLFSLNCNKANYIGHAVLNSLAQIYQIVLFQEPWVGRIGTAKADSDPSGVEITGLVHQSSWNQFVPVPPSLSSTPRVAIYTTKNNPNFSYILHLDIFCHPDIMALEVIPRGSPLKQFLITNIYNDTSNSALNLLLSSPLPDLPTIISGDFNLHHSTWSGRETTSHNTSGDALLEWATDSNLILLNEPGVRTFERGNQSSTIDLFWASLALLPIIQDWQVHHNLDFSSDHLPITATLSPFPSHTPSNPPKFIFHPDKRKPWCETFITVLNTNSPQRTEICSPEQLSRLIEHFNSALIAASLQHCAFTPLSPGASPWFTKEVVLALRKVRRARAHLRKVNRTTPTGTPLTNALTTLRACHNKLRQTISKAKRDWALNLAQEVEPSKIWTLTNWYKGLRCYAMPALTRPNHTSAISDEDKAELLRDTFFPPPPSLQVDPLPSIPNHNTRPHLPVLEQEIDDHLKNTSNSSAPGMSGISYRALKWAWKQAPNYITYILNWSLALGIHFPQWKKAITMVIPKPNKPDYSNPHAYRPIQLLECLSKLLEKIVAKRILYDCSRLGLIPPEQFGGVSSASCPDAGLALVHDVHESLNHSLCLSLLTLDVKGFFDSINHDQLLMTLYEMGFPLPTIKWVASFLTGRESALKIGDTVGPMAPMTVGVPQGSPISPILSVIYTVPILKDLNDSLPTSQDGIQVLVKSYIDDFSLLAISSSPDENISLLTVRLHQVANSLQGVGMRIDPSKSELIHFSRKHQRSDPPLITNLYNSLLTDTPATEHLRWLGIYFDRKLRFHHHITIMVNRASAVANRIRVLANTVRGLSQRHLRILTKTCMIPILTYAFPLWYTESIPQSLLNRLQSIMNRCTRHVSGAFCTTPTLATQALSHIPPISLTLSLLRQKAAARLLQRLPDSWRRSFKENLGTPGMSPLPTLLNLPHNKKTLPHLSPLLQLSKKANPKGERLFPFAAECAPHIPRLSDSKLFPTFSTFPEPIGTPDSEARANYAQEINVLLNSRHIDNINYIFCDGSYKDGRGGAAMACYLSPTLECSPDFQVSLGAG